MTKARKLMAAVLLIATASGAAYGETLVKKGKTASGDTCSVSVEKHADGSITALGTSGTSSAGSSAGTIASSSSAGGSSVNVQAGGGAVSSSSTTGGPGSTSASVMTVNGCTISTTSP